MEINESMLIIGSSKQHILSICICVKKKYADKIVTNGYLHIVTNGYLWVMRLFMFDFLAYQYFSNLE